LKARPWEGFPAEQAAAGGQTRLLHHSLITLGSNIDETQLSEFGADLAPGDDEILRFA
jgi:hypothetical protein